MAHILSLETSTGVCSAAIHDNGKLVAFAELHKEQAHASQLPALVNHVMQGAGITPQDLAAIAVSSGPGSYTGLRIGVSTAKGLCYALNIPLIAVNTLTLMAHQVNSYNIYQHWLCPMIDARRMEVYCCILNADLQMLQQPEAKVIDSFSFTEILNTGKVLFFGNGAAKCKGTIVHPNAVFMDSINPSASGLGLPAFEKYQQQAYEDLISFEPVYLKEFLIKKSTKSAIVVNKQ